MLTELRCNKCQTPIFAKVVVSNLLASIGIKIYKTKAKGYIKELYGDHSTVSLEKPYCFQCKKELSEDDMMGMCPITRQYAPFSELVIIGYKRSATDNTRKEIIHRKKCTDEMIKNYFARYEYKDVKIVSETPLKLDWSLNEST